MTTEVLRGVAEGAVKTAMSIEPMVGKTSGIGFIGLAIAVVASVVIANLIWDKIIGK
jgi:hypothetical protein